MTDWVLKGSIRGPAGEIPSVSQFLKIAGGALSNGDNEKIASLLIMGEGTSLSLDTSEMYSNIAVNGPSGSNKKIRLQSSSSSSTFAMDDKSVGSITDTILSGSGNALATDKAVKDYVDTSIADIDIPEALPEGGTEGQVLTKTSEGEAWSDIPDAFPAGGNTGQVLTKTSDGEVWSDIPDALPSGGTNGQVLTKTTDGEAWSNIPTELPQDGTTGQILKKGQNGAEWVDSIVVDTSVADVAARESVAIVDDPDNPKSGIVLKTDPETQKTIITGVGDKVVDEVHIADISDTSTAPGELAVNLDTMKMYVDENVPKIPDDVVTFEQVNDQYSELLVNGKNIGNISLLDGSVAGSDSKKIMGLGVDSGLSGALGFFANDLNTFDRIDLTTSSNGPKLILNNIVNGADGVICLQCETATDEDSGGTPKFTMGIKTVTGFTDIISLDATGDKLATDKAVSDYVKQAVDSQESLTTASNQDFCTYFGLQYDAAEWGDA